MRRGFQRWVSLLGNSYDEDDSIVGVQRGHIWFLLEVLMIRTKGALEAQKGGPNF